MKLMILSSHSQTKRHFEKNLSFYDGMLIWELRNNFDFRNDSKDDFDIFYKEYRREEYSLAHNQIQKMLRGKL